MRPTPDEIINSARTLLREKVAPGLSAEAQAYFRRVMSVLRDGRWNEAAFDLLHENEALAALVGRCADMTGTDALQEAQTALREALAAYQGAGVPRSFADANAMNRTLRSALCTLLEAMRDQKIHDGDVGAAVLATMQALQDAGRTA